MGVKLRTILSELASDVKALSLDDRISFRFLHNKLNSKLEYFLRLESKARDFLNDVTVWKTIDCLELIDIENNKCGYIDGCNTLKRSKCKIPQSFNTYYGQIIKVFTVSKTNELKIISSTSYKDYANREFAAKKTYCWIQNDYIYVPNTDLDFIAVTLIPKNAVEVDRLNNGSCDDINSNPANCISVLDTDYSFPDYLITLAKQEVLKEISGVYKRMIDDEKGDDNSNIKN